MKPKVLIVVENQTVPFDPPCMEGGLFATRNGYEVTVSCPRRKGFAKGYEVADGVRVPSPAEGSTAIGYLWEYTAFGAELAHALLLNGNK
jgi:hypothetical protein